MEARGVEPLFAQNMSTEVRKRLKVNVVELPGFLWTAADVPTIVPIDGKPHQTPDIKFLGRVFHGSERTATKTLDGDN